MSESNTDKKNSVIDLYLDHPTHRIYYENCSECVKNIKEFDSDGEDEVEPHPCRWCGTLTLNLECDSCDKKNDEAYFERHG